MTQFKLGTCCMIDENFSYRSTTAKSFFKEKDYNKLWEIWKHNLEKTDEAISFLLSKDSHFHFFRISSSLFPLATFSDELWNFYLSRKEEISSKCKEIGAKTIGTDFRIVTHPGQFCVLNSKTPGVVQNSLREIEYHKIFMESFGIPWSINVHLSGKDDDAPIRMISTVKNYMDIDTISHLSLENDEKSSSLEQIISVSQKTDLLVCFDVHHEAVNRTFKGEKYYLALPPQDSIEYIEKVWRDNLGLSPAFHLSNRLNIDSIKGDACAHSDFFYEEDNKVILPLLERGWHLECEAKKKFPAAEKLMESIVSWRN